MAFPPMPLLPITSPETIENCASLRLRPSDVFVCSYPKSGTTWTQHVVLSLLLAARRHGGDDAALDYDHVSRFAPFFEIDAHWAPRGGGDGDGVLAERVRAGHAALGRRVFNTHLRWEMLPKRAEEGGTARRRGEDDGEGDPRRPERSRPACAKFIYVARNQPDVCASFYHHLANQKEGTYVGGYEAFARDWMAGALPFGSPLHHLLSFAAGFGDNQYAGAGAAGRPLLLLNYERMRRDLRGEVRRIAAFLDLRLPAGVLDDELLPSFRFAHMRDRIERFQPRSVTWLNGYNFLRKGTSGDGTARLAAARPSLAAEYREWVEEEGYARGIRGLLAGDELRDARLLFEGLVGMDGEGTAEENAED